VLRLTGSERAVVELAATAEHMASLTAAAAGFMLQPDIPAEPQPPTASVALLDEVAAPGAAATLAEIRAWAAAALGVDRVPTIWRALAHHPRLLEAVWRKNRLILGTGILDDLVKGCAALAVAQFRQSPYWIAYQTQFLRHTCGLDDRALVEATAMMMHSLAFNTIAHGMRLDAPHEHLNAIDFAPGGRLAHTRSPGAPNLAAVPTEQGVEGPSVSLR
jgi:hypothetical protein